jgi:hypothetical protein
MNELMTWLRFSEAEAVATRDGLFSRASGNPAVPRWLARILLQVLFTAKSENEKYSAQILSSSGIAVFVSEQKRQVSLDGHASASPCRRRRLA